MMIILTQRKGNATAPLGFLGIHGGTNMIPRVTQDSFFLGLLQSKNNGQNTQLTVNNHAWQLRDDIKHVADSIIDKSDNYLVFTFTNVSSKVTKYDLFLNFYNTHAHTHTHTHTHTQK